MELWVGGANELAPGKISIPTISQYDEIGIAHNFDGSGALLIEHFKYASGQGGSIANLSLDTGKSGTAAINYCTRGFTLESDGITFQSGNMIYNNTLYTGWNNRCVPKYIYGIKH